MYKKFSFYLAENTVPLYYKHQQVNGIARKNRYLFLVTRHINGEGGFNAKLLELSVRKCLQSFGAESFVQVAIQKFKDQDI